MIEEHDQQLRMVAQSAADFAQATGGASHARKVSDGAPVWNLEDWRAMVELGWLGIAVSEEAGGLGLDATAISAVAAECGRALLMPPIAAALAGAYLLAEVSGKSPDAARAFESLMNGDECVAFAEAQDAPAGDHVRITLVADGDSAKWWLVARGEGPGFEVRLIRADQRELRLSARMAVDGSHLANALVERVIWDQSALLLDGEAGYAVWLGARSLLWIAEAAYLAGLTDSALRLAVEYMSVRKQFGVPIGSFQALQHRAADCYVDVKASGALVNEAARAWKTPQGVWAAAAAIHRAAETSLRVTKEVVQFHGAIGFADEHDAGLYLRRAMSVGARHMQPALVMLRREAPFTEKQKFG